MALVQEKTKTKTGQVVQVVGVVVDVEFAQGHLPAINSALKTKLSGKDLVLEPGTTIEIVLDQELEP